MSTATESNRIEALDGLRGLAALVVVFRHVFNSIEMSIEQQVAICTARFRCFSTRREESSCSSS